MSSSETISATPIPPVPTNPLVGPLLTDLYQITMTYAYWKNKRHDEPAVFELFFRRNPFPNGEYTVFAGLQECLRFIAHYQFRDGDIAFLKTSVPSLQHCEAAFWDWLQQLDVPSLVTVHALPEGSICFPRVPLLIIEAPLAVGQLLETTLLTLINYPSLVATNAARMVRAAEQKPLVGSLDMIKTSESHENVDLPPQCFETPKCVEFGLRRAQGPDGGVSASRYASLGGFVGTSHVLAAKLDSTLQVAGTHAHAFVQSYHSLDQFTNDHKGQDELATRLYEKAIQYRRQYSLHTPSTNDGELAAFLAYATAFPKSFLCLIDTYDTVQSGLLNFLAVALALDDEGQTPMGIRLDSGDLADLSMQCARKFQALQKVAPERTFLRDLRIVVSDDMSEAKLNELNQQVHAITMYGIGTHLVTCKAQPALGCVYKLVEIDRVPRIKFSQDMEKVLIPGRKRAYRFYNADEEMMMDVLFVSENDQDGKQQPAPEAKQSVYCRHPFQKAQRAHVTPTRVEALHKTVWRGGPTPMTNVVSSKPVQEQLSKTVPEGVLEGRQEYPVWVSNSLYHHLQELWERYAPVKELK